MLAATLPYEVGVVIWQNISSGTPDVYQTAVRLQAADYHSLFNSTYDVLGGTQNVMQRDTQV